MKVRVGDLLANQVATWRILSVPKAKNRFGTYTVPAEMVEWRGQSYLADTGLSSINMTSLDIEESGWEYVGDPFVQWVREVRDGG